jgi:hypothetical protein
MQDHIRRRAAKTIHAGRPFATVFGVAVTLAMVFAGLILAFADAR